MNLWCKAVVTAACLTILYSASESRAQAPAPPQEPPVNMFLFGRLQGGATLEWYLEQLRIEFNRSDANGDGKIDSADIDTHSAMAGAGMRMMQAMQIMGADLNGEAP